MPHHPTKSGDVHDGVDRLKSSLFRFILICNRSIALKNLGIDLNTYYNTPTEKDRHPQKREKTVPFLPPVAIYSVF